MKIAVCGYGRAGKAMIESILESNEHELSAVLCRDGSENASGNLSEVLYGERLSRLPDLSITPMSEAVQALDPGQVDVVVDFSHKDSALSFVEMCGIIHSNLVICTTGHSPEEIALVGELATEKSIGVVYAPNLTVGINLLMEFVAKLSKVFGDASFEILEKHPPDKAKPTATAGLIARSIGNGEIPVHSIRLDGFVGVHEVVASNGLERIVVSHESLSRGAFACGALAAAAFVCGKVGLYTMEDVVNDLGE
ncbi:4-hydroxy-tetrahydrodipicolinate reductase [Eggerthella guodeyinii]|nr:dihydrodipicolinate reductase C-terminal domain-containing protein [Eggerthella guodeyinii]